MPIADGDPAFLKSLVDGFQGVAAFQRSFDLRPGKPDVRHERLRFFVAQLCETVQIDQLGQPLFGLEVTARCLSDSGSQPYSATVSTHQQPRGPVSEGQQRSAHTLRARSGFSAKNTGSGT